MVKDSKKEYREIKEGIYEIVPIRKVKGKPGEIYSEYMNFNCNNGTIIYDRVLGHCNPSADIIKISDYLKILNKSGSENIYGGVEFEKFMKKCPEIYMQGLKNESKEELNPILNNEEGDEETI